MAAGQRVFVVSANEFGSVAGSFRDVVSVQLDSGPVEYFSLEQVQLEMGEPQHIGNPIAAF